MVAKNRLGALIVGVLATGMLVAGAPSAQGVDGEADYRARYSACVGEAIRSSGFQDTVGSFAERDINCIGHYGVTKGRTATMFSPWENVSRWQMALFLARAADPAGVILKSPARDQGFTDVGGLSSEARNAINALVDAEIMLGTSRTLFSPNEGVTRRSMALLLDAFLSQAAIGTGGTGPDDVTPDDQVFNDIDQVTLIEHEAIRRIYELGITGGVTEDQFGPERLVTRAQMAAFIGRTLGHTRARPRGLTLQANQQEDDFGAVELAISIRDTNFEPVVDAMVDTFSSTDPDNAFTSQGTCDFGKVNNVSRRACIVDFGDNQTDVNGDITLLTTLFEDTTFWAWTGQVNQSFGVDTLQRDSVSVGFVEPPTQFIISDDIFEDQLKLHFGQSVNVTVQLADRNDRAVLEGGRLVEISESITSASGALSSRTQTYRTDTSGRIQFQYQETDPSTSDNPDAVVSLVITSEESDLVVTDERTISGDYLWSDDAPVPSLLTVSLSRSRTNASTQGEGARNLATATLSDQYGDGIADKPVTFFSDDPAGIGQFTDGARRTTRRTGSVSLDYRRDSSDGFVESIWAVYDDGQELMLTSERVTHVWVGERPQGSEFEGTLQLADTRTNLIVLMVDGQILPFSYDSNDHLDGLAGPTSLTGFEKDLESGNVVRVVIDNYSDRFSNLSRFRLFAS